MEPLLAKLSSAHVMGSCAMPASEQIGVTRPDGVHWLGPKLSIHDGSLLPTSIGSNLQVSIYGLVNLLATRLAARQGGKPVTLA